MAMQIRHFKAIPTTPQANPGTPFTVLRQDARNLNITCLFLILLQWLAHPPVIGSFGLVEYNFGITKNDECSHSMSNGKAKGDVDSESFSVKLRIFRNQIAVPESPQNFDSLLDHAIFVAANRFKTFIAQVTKVRQRTGELATRFFIRQKSQIPLLFGLRNESLNYLCFKVFVHVQLGLMWNKKCGGLFGAGVGSVSEEHSDF